METPFIKLGEAVGETQKFFGGIADFWSGWKGIVVVLVVVVFLMLLLGVGIKTS